MKRLLAIAALLLASTAAQAQYSFEYGGKTIRIDPDRGTVQIPGVYDNTKKDKRSKKEESDHPPAPGPPAGVARGSGPSGEKGFHHEHLLSPDSGRPGGRCASSDLGLRLSSRRDPWARDAPRCKASPFRLPAP